MVFDFGSDSSIIVSIRSDIKNLQSGLNKANSEIKKFSNETDKGLKKTGVAGLNLGSILSTSLGFGIAQLASTGVRQIKQFVTESIGDFLNFEQALISFELVVGETSDSLINNLKKASGETISTLNLVSSANKALALGISKDQLPELMATATARAKIMGITATQAFNDIATGIGRQSRMILDNLGIILDLDKAYNEYAESLGRTAESLSEYEKKTAIANSVIKETSALVEVMGFTAESHKTKIERLTAAWEDFKISLGEGIVTIYDLSFGFKEFNSVLDDLPDDIQGKVKGWTTEYLDLNRALEASTSSLKILESEIRGFGSTPLEGETEKDLVIAEKKGELTKAELALENKKKEVRESGYTGDIDIMWSKEEENIKSITEELRILRLEKENEFINFKEIQSLKASLWMDEQKNIIKTKDEYLKAIEAKKLGWMNEKLEVEKLNVSLKETYNIIVDTIREASKLEYAKRLWGGMTFSPSLATYGSFSDIKVNLPQNDFISRGDGEVTPFSPQDTIIGLKQPSQLMGGKGVTVNVYANNIVGQEAGEELSKMIQRELKGMISY